ncbi:extracellular solute-binding protein [Paenibacillus algorifonticola]|uniref:extracellular solute-binding protein n=1 Tax=Paenibacillus algorifonticola TaxID=684063 RepID=UPI003D2A989D
MNKRMKLNVLKRMVTCTCISGVMAGVLAGCGSSVNEEAGTGATAEAGSGSTAINIMMIQFGTEPMKKESAGIKYVEDYTNTKLDFTWVPTSAYDDKVSATLASGKLPDLMLVRRNKDSAMLNAQLSGVFWELTPFLQNTKNLAQMSEIAKTNATIGGKLYGIPRERVLARYGMIFRKDWLDHLGLQQPKSVDDIYKIAKAFTENDPDGNGKNDTFGIQEDKAMELLKQLNVYNGGPNGWGLQDGKVMPDFIYPEFKKSLDLYKKMVDEKLIINDFPIAPKYDYFNKEKAGMYFSVIGDAAGHADLQKANPKVVIDVAQNFDGPKGERVRGTNGYDSLLAIPKSSVKTEEQVKAIIDFLDKMADKKMEDFIAWGLEGSDYQLVDGKPVKNEAAASSIGDLWNLRWIYSTSIAMQGEKKELDVRLEKLYEDNLELAVVDLSASLLSETNVQKGNELKTAITDAQTKYVLGELDEKGWNDAVAKWRKDGGDKIIEEFTADYNANHAK